MNKYIPISNYALLLSWAITLVLGLLLEHLLPRT